WRMTNSEAATSRPDDNEAVLRSAIRNGEPTGVLAYENGEPAGWCSISPRTVFSRVLRSTSLRPDDPEEPGVWAIACVYVRKEHRGRGNKRS
ncbi:MAG TPA: GNAT family N-acetyltransferase, partial [Trebonia sp.]